MYVFHYRNLLLAAALAAGIASHAKSFGPPQKDSTEFLDWASAKLDGKYFMIETDKRIMKLLGKPDSIVDALNDDFCATFYDRDFKQVFYRGAYFEQYGDSLVLMQLHFPEAGRHFIRFGKYVVDGSTTFADLKAKFPAATATPEQQKLDGKACTVVFIPVAEKLADDYWAFYFVDGRLVQLRYWIPC